jgi:hypothetical protein
MLIALVDIDTNTKGASASPAAIPILGFGLRGQALLLST